jgi:hypothetical protein
MTVFSSVPPPESWNNTITLHPSHFDLLATTIRETLFSASCFAQTLSVNFEHNVKTPNYNE